MEDYWIVIAIIAAAIVFFVFILSLISSYRKRNGKSGLFQSLRDISQKRRQKKAEEPQRPEIIRKSDKVEGTEFTLDDYKKTEKKDETPHADTSDMFASEQNVYAADGVISLDDINAADQAKEDTEEDQFMPFEEMRVAYEIQQESPTLKALLLSDILKSDFN